MEMAIDGSGKVNFPMRRTIKAAVLIICFSACTIGLLLSPKNPAKDSDTATQVVPVKNQQSHRGIWLRV
jgi:hypothetical protein